MISPVLQDGRVGRRSDGTAAAPLLRFAARERMSESSFDQSSGLSSTAESAGFWTLFVVQTAALFVLASYAIPVYRLLFVGPGLAEPAASARLPLFCAATLMQICYWSRRRFLSVPRLRRDDLSGHLLLFISRSLFVSSATFLPIAFFVRSTDTVPSPFGVVLVPLVLFAVFCYASEVERLGRTRLDPHAD